MRGKLRRCASKKVETTMLEGNGSGEAGTNALGRVKRDPYNQDSAFLERAGKDMSSYTRSLIMLEALVNTNMQGWGVDGYVHARLRPWCLPQRRYNGSDAPLLVWYTK